MNTHLNISAILRISLGAAIGVLSIMMLTDCSSSPVVKTLDKAEAIMEENPDSALNLLLSLPDSVAMKESDRAKYNLLFCQANVKHYNYDTSIDSLKHAAEYFEKHNDLRNVMKSHFYLADLYYNRDSLKISMKYAMNALDIAKALNDDYWHAKASEKIADLYMASLNPVEAIPYAQEGAKFYRIAGKERNSRFSKADIALYYACSGEYKRASDLIDSIYKISANKQKDGPLMEYCLQKMVFINLVSGKYQDGIKCYDELIKMCGEENIDIETRMDRMFLGVYNAEHPDSILNQLTILESKCTNARQLAKLTYLKSELFLKYEQNASRTIEHKTSSLV